MNFVNVVMLLGSSVLIFGCATSPYPKSMTMQEINQHEKVLQENYQQWLKNEKPKEKVKWVQPDNKTEPCKVFIGYTEDDDRTLKDGYEVFWDGECREGYAYGLGREFETSETGYLESIAIYPAGIDKQPIYYYEKIDKDYFIGIIGKDTRKGIHEEFKFDINDVIFMSRNCITPSPEEYDVILACSTSPLSHSITYQKRFPTDTVVLTDHRENVFSELNWEFATYDNKGRKNGIAGETYKYKPPFIAEFDEDWMLRQVTVPSNYDESLNKLQEEIINVCKEAEVYYQEAFEVINRYMDKICGSSISVDFISNEKYLSICTERTKLFEKVKEQSEIYQAQYKEQKKVFEEQLQELAEVYEEEQQELAEIQQQRKAEKSAEAWAALSGFVSGLAEIFSSYEHPTMGMPAPATYTPRSSMGSSGTSYQRYKESDCIGSVVNGRCVGTIRPAARSDKCFGSIINGECIGTELDY